MANLFIQEYAELAQDTRGYMVQAGREPALATQVVAHTATAGSSATFHNNTKFIRVVADTAAYLKFGVNPTAVTATDMPIQANTVEFFGVTKGQKVSAVS